MSVREPRPGPPGLPCPRTARPTTDGPSWPARSPTRPSRPRSSRRSAEAAQAGGPAGTAATAAEAWAVVAAAWERAGRPYDRAWARLREAESRFAAGDRDAARTAMYDAGAIAAGLAATPLDRRVDDLARRARVAAAPVRRAAADPGALTGREHEVLELMAEGYTNPQIADRLFLSPKTVGIHVSRVLAKLDAHTRGEAAAVARRRGLIA